MVSAAAPENINIPSFFLILVVGGCVQVLLQYGHFVYLCVCIGQRSTSGVAPQSLFLFLRLSL